MSLCRDFPDAETLIGQGQDAGFFRFALPPVYLPAAMPQPGLDGFGLDTGGDAGRADRGLGRHAASDIAGDQIGDSL